MIQDGGIREGTTRPTNLIIDSPQKILEFAAEKNQCKNFQDSFQWSTFCDGNSLFGVGSKCSKIAEQQLRTVVSRR